MARDKKKVAIVGFGHTWRKVYHLDRKQFEVWGFNDRRRSFHMGDADRWFQLHNRDYLDLMWEPWQEDQTYIGNSKTPIYLQDEDPEIPNSRRFPREKVEGVAPHGRYHASSVDWLVAYAILLGFKEIHIYGVDFGPMDAGEPLAAKACLEYWIGVAEGKGIKVVVPRKSSLFKIFMYIRADMQYGYEQAVNMADYDKRDHLHLEHYVPYLKKDVETSRRWADAIRP